MEILLTVIPQTGAASNGVVSIAVNPGNLTTGIFRHMNFVQRYIIERPLAYPPIYGAYAILYAGLSEEVTAERVKTENWGKYHPLTIH